MIKTDSNQGLLINCQISKNLLNLSLGALSSVHFSDGTFSLPSRVKDLAGGSHRKK